LAALVSVFVPQDFFEFVSNKPVLEMFLMLLISLPLYVCATASVPLAAVFLINGISPGAVLVFLMAGPATNIATITVIGNSLGRKTLISYLGTIILSSIIFGLMINFLFPTDFFISENNAKFAHNHSLGLFYHISAVLLILMLIFSYIKTYYFQKPKLDSNMDLKFKVKDMTCKHCVANVEKALANMDGVRDIKVNLTNKTVYLKADSINKTLISEIVQDAGYSAEFL
jgi:copper ion binding protein